MIRNLAEREPTPSRHLEAHPSLERRASSQPIALVLAFGEALAFQAMAALAEQDGRFWLGCRSHQACAPQQRLALVDERQPSAGVIDLLQQPSIEGCVVLTGHVRSHALHCFPHGLPRITLPWQATWAQVSSALLELWRREHPLDVGPCSQELGLAEEHAALRKLTRREKEVLRLIADGYSVRRIGAALHLAESTVDNHKSRLMKKIGAKKSIDLARFAYRLGLALP